MKTILIADPEYGAGSMADLLQRDGYRSIPETSAQAALDILQNGARVDLVITELLFSDMDGIEFVADMRRIKPDLPVVVVTEQGSIESYLKALSMGVIEYLNKPIMESELRRIVKFTLGGNDSALRNDA